MLILTLAVAALAPSPAYPQSLSVERRPTTVAAYRGHVVWSSYRPALRAFVLVDWSAGHIRRLAVAPRRRAFDVDLGPGPHGHLTAVYARCSDEPGFALGRNGLPNYASGKGCDVFRYDFHTKAESRLRVIDERDASEYMPSISGGHIVFARRYERRSGLAGALPHLYYQSLRGGRAKELRPGPRGSYEMVQRGSRRSYTGGPGPISLRLRGSQVGLVWGYEPANCPGGTTSEGSPLGLAATVVRLYGPPGQARALASACDANRIQRFSSLSLQGSTVFYSGTKRVEGDSGNVLWRAAAGQPTAGSDLGAPVMSTAVFGQQVAQVRPLPEHDYRTFGVEVRPLAGLMFAEPASWHAGALRRGQRPTSPVVKP